MLYLIIPLLTRPSMTNLLRKNEWENWHLLLLCWQIFVSCMGLFVYPLLSRERRTREIWAHIRKVVGASVFNIWQMLSREFMGLITISSLIAIPIAYYFLHEWLQKYEYRTGLSWWIFAAGSVGALLFTIITVSFQAIKAAVANPVKSLRTE